MPFCSFPSVGGLHKGRLGHQRDIGSGTPQGDPKRSDPGHLLHLCSSPETAKRELMGVGHGVKHSVRILESLLPYTGGFDEEFKNPVS